jgi:hydrogenase expression/formation protein HypC
MVTAIGAPENGLVMGKVNFGGVEREVCFGYTPEAKIGDYVLVHVGFALSVLDPEAAHQILADLSEIERLGAEDNSELEPSAGAR